MKRYILLAALLLACLPALAGNSNANPCGNNGNNCNPAGGGATATGGDAYASGGTSIAGAAAGALAGAASNAQVGDITNIAAGGQGGRGGDGGNALAFGGAGGEGGNAQQGQAQGQKQSATAAQQQGQSSQTSTSTEQHQAATATNAGNSQQVGGQSTNIKFEDVANAPPVFLGNISATMSCSGGFNAGGSSQDGSGALGFSWVSGDCRSVVAADKFRELGMVDTACKILKTTKGFKRAVKSDPSLADVSCSIAK
jgi:hypothetical protein